MKHDEIIFLDGGGYLNFSHYMRVLVARWERELSTNQRPPHFEYLKMHHTATAEAELSKQIDEVYLSTQAELKSKS